jgi:hypothetical protein
VYTESQLNGDGNYVHYLIYQSKQDPRDYYFGFEDLWRGGDNDFEDMAIKVRGLIKPCEPTQEICDGLDNNCDGLIDNDPVDVGQVCTSIPGNRPGVGPCKAGTLVCASKGPNDKTKSCIGEVGPTSELCNKVDDDCDGVLDDNPTDPEIDTSCGPTNEGTCEYGKNVCVAGVLTCVGVMGPALEICDGFDNDCDGVTDGIVAGAPTACTTDADCQGGALCLPSAVHGGNVCAMGPADAIGACVFPGSTCPGVRRCVTSKIACVETTQGADEVCDGADNNCNGLVDEGDPGGGADCGPGGIPIEKAKTGQCLPGVMHCIGATLVCVGGRGPSAEICDGLDNNCDGQADEAAECPGESMCVMGKCAEPCTSGEFPCPGGLTCVAGYCVKDAGTGGAAGAAGGGGDGGPDGSAGTGGTASGGTGGSGRDAGLGGTGGIAPDRPPAPRNWGLTTGGGGSTCALGRSSTSFPAALLALIFAGLSLRRAAGRTARRRP